MKYVRLKKQLKKFRQKPSFSAILKIAAIFQTAAILKTCENNFSIFKF
jgi:hypothetical protein